MDNSQKLALLKKALTMTHTMQEMANNALWDELTVIEQQRGPILDSVFPLEVADNEIRAALEQIVELNNSLEQQCAKAKAESQQQLKKMTSSKKAVSAYQQI